ncbi:MAG: hypothetical protein AB7F31_07390 [Parachlamydiales bacterium]
MQITVPLHHKKTNAPDQIPSQLLFEAIGSGKYLTVSRLLGQGKSNPKNASQLIERIDNTVKQQFATYLEGLGLTGEDALQTALILGSAPYAWSLGKTASLPIPIPYTCEGPGKKQIFYLQIPYSAPLLHKLSPLFWGDRSELERALVFSLNPDFQEAYYLALWDTEDMTGLKRLATPVAPNTGLLTNLFGSDLPTEVYNHSWVWKVLFKRRGLSPHFLGSAIKILEAANPNSDVRKRGSVNTSPWLETQEEILKQDPFLPLALRRAGGIGKLKSIFSPPLANGKFPNYEKQPLPLPQGLLENLPIPLFAQVLADLSITDLLTLSRLDHWMNATLGGTEQANRTFWEPLVKNRYAALRQIHLKDAREWHKAFQEEIAFEWCVALINLIGPDTLVDGLQFELSKDQTTTQSPYHLARFLDRADVGLLRACYEPLEGVPLHKSRAQRFTATERWSQLVTEGAMLSPQMAEEWWDAVAKRIRPDHICEIVSRIGSDQFPLFAMGLMQRTTLPPLSSKDSPSFPLDKERHAGEILLFYLLLGPQDPLYETLQGRLTKWFDEESQLEGTTLAFRAIVDGLVRTLGLDDFHHNYEPQVLITLLHKARPTPALALKLRTALIQCASKLVTIPVDSASSDTSIDSD